MKPPAWLCATEYWLLPSSSWPASDLYMLPRSLGASDVSESLRRRRSDWEKAMLDRSEGVTPLMPPVIVESAIELASLAPATSCETIDEAYDEYDWLPLRPLAAWEKGPVDGWEEKSGMPEDVEYVDLTDCTSEGM